MASKHVILAALVVLLASLAACGSSDSSAPGSNDPNVYIDGFDPGSIPDGYTRIATPVIHDIEPGADEVWCQYVSQPFAEDTDVLDVSGAQSKGGHHVVLYATKGQGAYGTSRECGDSDMTRIIFLGGFGGEGTTGVAKAIPPGMVFRVPAGYSLMANIHFINATSKPMDGQGVIDVKMAPADPAHRTLSLFTNVATDGKLVVPAHAGAKLDVSCKLQKDLDVYTFANHMHEHGTAAVSTLIHADGTRETLHVDTTWSNHLMFDPTFTTWDAAAPLRFKAGDTVATHCEWNNTTDQELRFPTEMCVGFAFFAGLTQIDCIDGEWTE